MPQRAGKAEAGEGQVRRPAGVVLKPPVSVEDLRTDTEYDPEGAEEFVALIRALRNEALGPRFLEARSAFSLAAAGAWSVALWYP